MKKIVLVAVMLLSLCSSNLMVLAEGEQASSCSQFHGDERHNGFLSSVGPTSAVVTWKINQQCDGMIAASGRLIIVRPDEKAHIFNETDGTHLAEVHSDWYRMRTCYPVIGEGKLFLTFYHWHDYTSAKNLFTLTTKWDVELGESRVYVRVPYNYYLLTYWNGKLFVAWAPRVNQWERPLPPRLSAYSAATGTNLWRVEFDDA
ncbi:hypothetical protein, partial [Infirmifilum sp.]|uniref:hypothetical protein n=1 Tax=Infirmifilum sp. TaxID=2856575 RepID=UPI003D0B2B27